MDITSRVIEFWFGDFADPEYGEFRSSWFVKDTSFDDDIKARFLSDYQDAVNGLADDQVNTPADALAMIIMLDQFPRNMFRNTPEAFAADDKAMSLARKSIAGELDHSLIDVERLFLYMPYQHSENIDDQERSVNFYRDMGNEQSLQSAVRHRDIIAKFGRFPHRNEILGRISTKEETEFLRQPESSF